MFKLIKAALFLPLLLSAQDKARHSPGTLPVKRVVLFKNGVGYFEHIGSVHGNEAVSVSFTSGQLNDVLKSLTVLDLNGGHIAGVDYGTAAPVARQLSDLRLPISEHATLAEVLSALRGTRIEIRTGASTATGRLLSVERKTRVASGTSQDFDYVSLLSESGELRTLELSPSSSVRLLEPGLTGKLDRFLDLVSSERDADTRTMVISTEGTGDRNLYVSYISEVPVWKSTYRLVLNPKTGQSPLLQGWAIVDNVVGEDWNNVELSLVAGAPQSFIQNLSQPYYAQRATIALPDTVSSTPQTYEATLIPGSAQIAGTVTDPSGAGLAGATVRAFDAGNSLAAQTTTDAQGRYEIPSVPDGPIHLQIEARGFQTGQIDGLTAMGGRAIQQNAQLQVGSVNQTVEVSSSSGPVNGRMLGSGRMLGKAKAASPAAFGPGHGGGMGGGAFKLGNGFNNAAALSQTLGDLFEYKLKDKITIQKNRSALVPIAQASIKAEKVSVWNDGNSVPRPERAVWITNTTGLTLDGGSVSVLEDDTFTGEGIFDPIRPDEKRLISYATDLAVTASARNQSEAQRVARVLIAKGTMTQQFEQRETRTYTFRNQDSTPRTIIVEHPVRPHYELRGDVKPVETTPDWMRFRLEVKPQETASLTVQEALPSETQFTLSNITTDQVALFVSQRTIDPTIQMAFQEIVSQKNAISALQAEKSANDEETEKIFDDQERLRENIKALKGTPEEKPLLQRYTQQLNDQETRLANFETQTGQLDAKIDAANGKLDDTIQKLAFDVRL